MSERIAGLDRQPGRLGRLCLAARCRDDFRRLGAGRVSQGEIFRPRGRCPHRRGPLSQGPRWHPPSGVPDQGHDALYPVPGAESRSASRSTGASLFRNSLRPCRPPSWGFVPAPTIRVEDAIKALITLSANDVAVAIGENLSGSETAFAKRMTKTARALGMSRTTFRNASGLPNPAQVTTARDMATLSLRVQRDFPQYYPYFRTMSFKYGKRVIRTHNRLLGRFAGTDGIKTGYIRASGFNLTTSAQRGDKRIIGVVMGASSGAARNNYMIAMLGKAFPQCKEGRMLASAVQGAGPASATALAAVGPAKSLPVLAAAKPQSEANPQLVMPDPIPSDFVTANAAPDSEAAAEEDTAKPRPPRNRPSPPSIPPPAGDRPAPGETKAGAQDSAKIVIASTAPAATLPFGVKKNAPGARAW